MILLLRHSHGRNKFEDVQGKERERSERPASIGRVQGQDKDPYFSRSNIQGERGRGNGRRESGSRQERGRREESQTGRHGRRYNNWDQKRGNDGEQTRLEKDTLNQKNSGVKSYTPEYNDMHDNIVESGDGGFYHGVQNNFQKQIGELADTTSPHHPPSGTEDYEATIMKQQSRDYMGKPNDFAHNGEFWKRKQGYVKERSHSDSGHGAYMDDFEPSPEQGNGGFDPLFRPSTLDPRHTASYQQDGSNVGSKYSGLPGIETPNYPYDLSSHGKHSTAGGGIDWGSWGPESTFESSPEFDNQLDNQHDDLKDQTKDYDYPVFDTSYKVQPDDRGEDFGNEIYYEKDQSSNERGNPDADLVPHFDFDDFHRSADSWY